MKTDTGKIKKDIREICASMFLVMRSYLNKSLVIETSILIMQGMVASEIHLISLEF